MLICAKKQKQCLPSELEKGNCWIGLSLANTCGLILTAPVGKHTDALVAELVVTPEGKTNCKQCNSDEWGGYQRGLPPEVEHFSPRTRHNDLSGPMILSGSRQEGGTDGRTSSLSYGNKRK
jgi:hypothetical protein